MMKRTRPAAVKLALTAAFTLGLSQGMPVKTLPGDVTLLASAVADHAAAGVDSESSGSGPGEAPRLDTTAEPGITRSAEADDILRRAESHFQAGRRFYFEGNLVLARREFDQAVDDLLKAPESLPDHGRIERRLGELCNLIYRFDVEKLGAGKKEGADEVAFDQAPIDAISQMTFGVDEKLAPKLQSELTQVTSGIPLELEGPVPGMVQYFSSTDGGRRTLLAGFKRAGRYRPLIERILAEEGMPQELIYLAQAESGFLPRAVSYKNAVGMWQFVADTGSIYKLARTRAYDERLDPEKATRAAARFLKDLHQRYGDWYLAIAAYNCGAGTVDRAIERTGYADYWELLKRHVLPRETSNYVPIIVAMTIIAKNPRDYGLDNIQVEEPVQYDSIALTAPTHLDLIADATMQPISMIRDLNPSLLGRVAPGGFTVHVPAGSGQATLQALETVPANNRHAWRLHHVAAGDTLDAIAKSYKLSTGRIEAVNAGASALQAGDVLLIPAAEVVTPAPRTVAYKHSSKGGRYSPARSSRRSTLHQGSGVAASRRVPSRVLHRRSAVQ